MPETKTPKKIHYNQNIESQNAENKNAEIQNSKTKTPKAKTSKTKIPNAKMPKAKTLKAKMPKTKTPQNINGVIFKGHSYIKPRPPTQKHALFPPSINHKMWSRTFLVSEPDGDSMSVTEIQRL